MSHLLATNIKTENKWKPGARWSEMDDFFKLKFSSRPWLDGMKNFDFSVTMLQFVLIDWDFLNCLVLQK